MNAGSFTAPFGVPVLQVGSEHGEWLDAVVRAGTPLQLVAQATRTRVEAQNVVVSVKARPAAGTPELSPIVVMTPRSGWWHCASERGGGLACWLEALRALASAGVPRSATFVASSGHELGHLGLESFIDRRFDLVKGAAAWVHLGANIGAANGRARLQSSDDRIEQLAVAAMARAGAGSSSACRVARCPPVRHAISTSVAAAMCHCLAAARSFTARPIGGPPRSTPRP